ncbi:MAG TPA: DUF6582 domain-containing protein [Candidatus Limnocylindria bacterium]|nr:DUF6582 domain-containing protein [Candidatus Limnocylindria bacterium]
MAELTSDKREALRSNQFAYVDRDGEEHLPIHDESHVRNAIARFNQTHFQSKTAKNRARRKILRAAKRFGIEVDEAANVRKAS